MKKLMKAMMALTLVGLSSPQLYALDIPIIGSLLAPEVLGNLTQGLPTDLAPTLSAVPALAGDFLQPAVLTGLLSESGIPLLPGFVPVLGFITTDPLYLPFFILDGGSLLSSALTLLPEIPLISAPLPGL